ncbi:MAG: hypothetical protein DCC68_17075, partial [Planctomycetota bacterium]
MRQWLKHGAVCVNGEATTRFDYPLSPGDVVAVRPADEVRSERRLPRGLTIRFEDEALLVIEKPAGLLSTASEGERDKTAQAYLTRFLREGNPRRRERAWVVHRLDRATSGLMVFAKSEAMLNGFDEALVLTADGHASEGSAENLFVVRDGVLITPPVSDDILEGITRAGILEIARELNIPVLERSIDRTEVYIADEVFM